MSVFRNQELVMAGQCQYPSKEEGVRMAEAFFGIDPGMTYMGRTEERPEGQVLEIFDRIDGPQEHPFFCIIR